MKHKKILIAIYIIIVITMATAGINKIFAASVFDSRAVSNNSTNDDVWSSVTEGDTENECNNYESDTDLNKFFSDVGGTTAESLQRYIQQHGIYKDSLDDSFYWFCVEENIPLPYSDESGKIFKVKDTVSEASLEQDEKESSKVAKDRTTALYLNAYNWYKYGDYYEYKRDYLEFGPRPRRSGDPGWYMSKDEVLAGTYRFTRSGDSININKNGDRYDVTFENFDYGEVDRSDYSEKLGYPVSMGTRPFMYISREEIYSSAEVQKITTTNTKNYWAKAYILALANKDDTTLAESGYRREQTYYETKYQEALWNIIHGQSYKDSRVVKLENEARAFESYMDSKGNNVKPELKNTNDCTLIYNREDGYYLLGPIQINYGSLTASYNGTSIDVRKIKDLKVTCRDKNGNTKTLVNNFYFSDENGNNETSGNFPGSNNKFYIKVKEDAISGLDQLEKMEFNATFCNLDAEAEIFGVSEIGINWYYWIEVELRKDSNDEDDVDDGEYILSPVDLNKVQKFPSCLERKEFAYLPYDRNQTGGGYYARRVKLLANTATQSQQNLWLVKNARLFWRTYDLKIGSNLVPQVIDIGGKVWVDMPSGDKTMDENGIYDSRENGRQNVKVTLYFAANHQEVKKGTNYVNREKVVVEHDDRNHLEGDVYTTYTNTHGEYSFYGLPAGYKYYVEFEYDGSEYEIVDYLAGENLAEGNETLYLRNPNSSTYYNNSKVKDESDRHDFETRFSNITYRENDLGKIFYGRTYGRNNYNDDEDLEYITGRDRDDIIRSKIKTTDDDNDVYRTGNEKTGKAIAPHIMTARTAQNYPLDNIDGTDYLKHINLGLKIRPKADLALQVQLSAGAMTIKDKEKVVKYKPSANDYIVDGTNLMDEYVKQEIAASDYNWKANFTDIYGDGGENITGFVVDEDKLKVYVLYKIVIENQCDNSEEKGKVNGLIDYYDNRLELVPEGEIERVASLFGIPNPNSLHSTPDSYNLSWVNNINVNWTPIDYDSDDYKAMLTGNPITIDNGNKSEIYLVLKVKDNGNVLYTGTDSDTDGMQNIAEITSYSIVDSVGNSVGKIDKDSAPGNAIPGKQDTYEDDTDPAPMFRLEINWTPREITGNVWDELIKNGILDENEIDRGVKDVTVKLIEHISDGNGGVKEIERPGLILDEDNKEVYTNPNPVLTHEDGSYTINVEGGDYSLKFIYGNTDMLLTNKKYNGQDYQATTYQALLPEGDRLDVDLSDLENDETQQTWEQNHLSSGDTDRVSSARDLANIRADIIRNTSVITYENGSILRKLDDGVDINEEDAKYLSGNDNEDNETKPNYTYMEAVTDTINIASNDLREPKVINLGLKERPKVELELQKGVKRIVLKTSDGTTLIDTSDATKLSNLQKLGDLEHEIDTTFINMDTVLMDGATLDIDYEIKVITSGEEDTLNNYIYDTDEDSAVMLALANEQDIQIGKVKTEIFDYVNINLDYREDDNEDWTTVYDEDAGKTTLDIPLSGEAQAALPKGQKLVSQVLQTTTEDLDVASGESVIIPIHLGITLSETTIGSDLNDFDFSNCAEIVTVYSGSGRRQYETTPGNYVPYNEDTENDEKDDDITGITTITPPLGQERIYYVIAIVSATILIAGIIIIKKKVLKK